jgi:hypothetical protein
MYELVMGPGGNLVEFRGKRAIWASGTSGNGSRVTMRADGDLVIYHGRTALWQSGTRGGHGRFELVLPNSGDLVIREGSKAIWARSSSLSAGGPA